MSRGRSSFLVFAAAGSLALIAVWPSVVTPSFGQGPVGVPGQGITWRSDLNSARQEAAGSGRNLLLHFWAPWCGPCRRLETTVFNQPAIYTTLQQGFIPVKINADELPQIARTYGVDRLPTDVILRPDGAVLAKMTSPQNPSAYIAQVAAFTAPGRSGTFSAEQVTESQPSGPGAATAYANLQATTPETVPFPAGPQNPAARRTVVQDDHGYGNPPLLAHQPSSDVSTPAAGPSRYGPAVAGQFSAGYGNYPASVPMGGFVQPSLSGVAPQTAAMPQSPQEPDARYAQPPAVQQGTPSIGTHQDSFMARSNPVGGATPLVGSPAPAGEADQPRLGLEGFCPVTLKREQRWVAGDKRYGIVHRGCLYLFAGPEQQQLFWGDPDHFSPVLSGIDPVLALDNGATVRGRREHGVEYNGWVYLFSSESTLQHFSRNPERYAGGVRQAMSTGGGTTFR